MGSESNCDSNSSGKMGIMATGCGVNIVTVMATTEIELFSPFHCHCRHSVNEPLKVQVKSWTGKSNHFGFFCVSPKHNIKNIILHLLQMLKDYKNTM